MYTIHGWLLDLYTHPRHGKTCLWIIQQDGTRTCLQHAFPGIFYVSGTAAQLQRAENYLYARFATHMQVTQEHRQQTIQADSQPVLAVRTPNPLVMQRVFHSLENELPALDYYNVDLNASLYYAAQYGMFALCHLSLQVDERQHMLDAAVEDSPWNLDTAAPPLRIMRLVPNHNPRAQTPTQIMLNIENQQFTLTYQSNEELARKIAPFLRRYDPDVLLTDYGDGYLLHALQVGSEGWIEPLPLNRDLQAPLQILKERSYHSYGQLFYRPQAVFLSGRHHIDMESSFFWQDSGLEGILEVARVTAQSLQRTARTTPGTGISSMQIVEALRSDILVPYKKQIPERERSAVNLLQHDMGGLIMQPIIGLHANVGAVDFISMYPSLMVRCNISPECVPHGLHETHDQPGLIPRTLAPLLDKRVALKVRMQKMADKNPQKQYDKMRSEALKWLLVTCFGYLGYKNARFGRIESHEAVTGAGREALLLAKEVAEEMDFLVLHAIVDSLFVQRAGCTDKDDFQPLLVAIAERTGLPIGVDGVFRWVAFPPSRMDARVSVPNRYFGVFQDGSLKVRGIEARRRDVPPFIKDTQMEVLRILAQAPTLAETSRFLPEAFDYSARRRRLLALNRVEPSELVIRHKLSRTLADYRMATPASIAARELLAHGKDPQPGEVIHFLHTRGSSPARLWQPGSPFTAKDIDPRLYLRIFDRAIETILGLFEDRFPEVRKAGHQYSLPVKNARPLLPHLAK